MPFWKSSDSPSSSCSNDHTTTPSSISTRSLRHLAFLRSHRHHRSHPQPRLTRQPKLRHLTDLDIRGVDSHPHPFRSSSVSANSTRSLSPSNQNCSALPLPLPLPNHQAHLRRDGSVDFPVGRWGILWCEIECCWIKMALIGSFVAFTLMEIKVSFFLLISKDFSEMSGFGYHWRKSRSHLVFLHSAFL